MSNLNLRSEAIWGEIKNRIRNAITVGAIPHVKEFWEYKRERGTGAMSPVLMVIDRRISVREWSANRGIADMTVIFGITTRTTTSEAAGAKLSEAVWTLVDMFSDDPKLGSLVFDTHIREVAPDAEFLGNEVVSQPWAVASITWGL